MRAKPFRIERLNAAHDRDAFDCGTQALTLYLKQQASQDERRRIASCFIAIEAATNTIAGYYTLSAASVDLSALPDLLANKLPRYRSIPAIRLGRLAIAVNLHGQGLGAALLWDAMQRAARIEIGAFALLVDAIDANAARFYAHHGFEAFTDQPLLLFRPLKGV